MPTIQFSNGHTVQFSAMPTQADIEQLGQQMGLHSATPPVVGHTANPPSTSPFNPNTPNSQFTQPTPAGAKQMQYPAGSGTTTASQFMQHPIDNINSGIAQAATQVAQKTGQQYMDTAKGFGQDFQNLNQHSQQVVAGGGQNWGTIKPQAKMGLDVLSMGAHTIQGVFAPLTALFQQSAEGSAGALNSSNTFNNAVTGFDQSPGGQKVNNLVSSLNDKATQLQQANPTAFKALQDGMTVLAGLVGEKPTNQTGSATVEGFKSGLDTMGNVANKVEGGMSNVADNIKTQVKSGVQDFRDVSAGKADAKANALSGKITQGEAADVPTSKGVLSNVDLTDVQNAPKGQKTQALKSTLDQSVKTQSEAIDQSLGSNKQTYKLSDTGTKVGKTISNPVQDGIDQLKQFYTDTKNPDGLAKITALEQKAQTQGITVQEINNLAKEQGVQINAYKANGDLASSKAKVAAENTRMGIKQTVDRLSGTDTFGKADAQLSDTMRVRDLMDTRAEAVQKLQQKIIEQPWYKKLGAKGAKLIDTLSGGNLKSAFNYFTERGQGLKTLNALDLEKSLQKDLLKLQDLANTKSSSELQTKLNEYISQNEKNPAIPKGETTQSTVKAADLGQQKMPSTIKVNDYRSKFPKYFTEDQINSATEMLKQLDNQGKTIDMKQVNSVVKRVKQMSDIKLNPGVKNGQGGNVVIKGK